MELSPLVKVNGKYLKSLENVLQYVKLVKIKIWDKASCKKGIYKSFLYRWGYLRAETVLLFLAVLRHISKVMCGVVL